LRLSDFRKKGGVSARERKITYEELFEACEQFEKDDWAYDEAWVQAKKFVDWRNLDSLPLEEIENRVILFLNRWACHLPTQTRLAERIKDVYRKSVPFLQALDGEAIQDIDFDQKKKVENNEHRNSRIMLRVFQNFYSTGYHFRDVAASKVLHMVNPDLFVMWDTRICRAYSVQKSPKGYVYDFIPLMKKKANEVIESYMKNKEFSREKAVKALNEFRPLKTLAKLLDEYNYLTYTRES